MKTEVREQGRPLIGQIGCQATGLQQSGMHDCIEDLKQQLKEATFLGQFMGAISGSLNPKDICAIASRLLFDFIPYVKITFTLAPEFGIKELSFAPGASKPTKFEAYQSVTWQEVKPNTDRKKYSQNRSLLEDLEKLSTRLILELPEKLGSVEIQCKTRNESTISPSFLVHVTDLFAKSLRNAREHSKMKELAMHDSLTGLFNRRVFDEILTTEGRRKEVLPISILIVDLDDFKKVNDTFGHPAGDKVLSTVGTILRESCRGSDVVARYGGEEFAVLLPATAPAIAYEIAQRMRSRLAATTFVFEDEPLQLTASIGIASTSELGCKVMSDLVQRADKALYQAKQNGKDRVHVSPNKTAGYVKKRVLDHTCCVQLQTG